ncbi:hypothetical protein DFP72DRAFT_297435 [Ephemerocybe angulata]|uniref:tRNA-dihydrouridine(16/17) synthase [NAD(P)(+)] n=1 Tax=Ephemerocybe angulata TaxID=980116 RepID=A0A8H6LU52_9AGAR|nr:hypothetical protein DFP72DRAFT_297435 [Tulosesus angulatus]
MRIERSHLLHIAAPMVNQSDLPFRCLVESHGATMSYTQMLIPERLLNDKDYYEFHTRDLTLLGERRAKPVVVQLCGNDVDEVVRAGRKLQSYCDGIDLNLGCPLDAARDARYGAYLLGQKDWPLVEDIVSSMAISFTVPVSAKLRLCQPVAKTHELAQRLEAQGASWITLHARTVSSKRRRQGAADLDVVKDLKTQLTIPTISNGNVRSFDDLERNLLHTGADGLMVGETLLGNPCIFTDEIPDHVAISLEYIDLCNKYPGTATLSTVQAHIRRFVEFQW